MKWSCRLRTGPNTGTDLLWLEKIVDQLVNNVVSVLLNKLQTDGFQIGTNVVADLSQKLGYSLENKMRK